MHEENKIVFRIILSNNGGGARKNIYFANRILESNGYRTITYIKKPKFLDKYSHKKLIDMIYCHSFVPFLINYLLNRKKSHVITLHLKNTVIFVAPFLYVLNIPYMCFVHQDIEKNKWTNKYTNFVYFFLLKKSIKVISISNFIYKRLEENGVRSVILLNASEKIISENSKRPKNRIGIVGELVERKGILEADSIAECLNGKYHIKIYGKGRLQERVEQFTFAKYLGYKELNEILKEVDILLFLSYNEPFGRIVTEFMSAGLPVLVRDSGEPPNIVKDSRQIFGEIGDLEEKLKYLKRNYYKIGAANKRRFVNYYSFEKYSENLIEIYKKI